MPENPEEPLLTPSLLPYPQIWQMYKKAQASRWRAEKVDLSEDLPHWGSLSDGERHFITHVLAFFATSSHIVLMSLAAGFMSEIQVDEAGSFCALLLSFDLKLYQMSRRFLETYIKDSAERDRLSRAIRTVPCINKKVTWALQRMNDSDSFAERIVFFACFESIFLSGSFCAIFWLKKKRRRMPTLNFFNYLISRDVGLHCDFACLLYSLVRNKLSEERLKAVVSEAVEMEREFVCDALPCTLVGMNGDLMSQYIEFVADRLLGMLGCGKVYNVQNPFRWLELISLHQKLNFKRRVGQ